MGSSPHHRVGHAHHADQHDALKQPRLCVHVHDAGHAAKHGRAHDKVQEHLRGVGGVGSGQVRSGGGYGEVHGRGWWGVVCFYPVSADEPLAAGAGAEPLLEGVF